ncbi:MAG: FTR1 family protein, partial [Candidatus Roizmanbacteria bacterium]|nr:FTR1 family protein [Candidatus Roizmanbacteria bacterium]
MTAIIAFREFLEAFLIVGMFLGISRKLKLKKEAEIIFAAALGILLSLLLATGTYLFGDHARNILTEKNADFLESYLMIFSGLFIAYVVFSLHDILHKNQAGTLVTAHKKLQQNVFDISLFFTIIFLVIREGFEIALFTASTSLFSSFLQNIYGLLLGFIAAIFLGIVTFFAYIKFPIRKVFKATEYFIIILGASLVQNGVTKLFETHFGIHLSNILPIPLKFLPDGESVAGHMFKG